ncbi:MAG TPA: 3-phosphoserine/phosphohydroxythreonine transaminase [Edaphocola sp.]|nr:3-phosphoserine/phosphohydroxythreonine transaminase [Edaphocola sp.]
MKINFGAGPAALPQEVLEEAAKAIIEYEDSGLSILSLGHRSIAFAAILAEAKMLTLKLLDLNDNYEVLWFQGGGRLQFDLIPMNYLSSKDIGAYIDSGHWAADAIANVSKYGKLHIAASTKEEQYRSIPKILDIPNTAKYVYLNANNTIYGTQFHEIPKTTVPLIGDFSSELFSRTLDYSKFSMIFAVAQKNLGPAGVTMVIVKKSFLQDPVRPLADILNYQEMAAKNSLVNTAPVFSIYVSLLNLRFMSSKGLKQIELENDEKAKLLYDFIDNSTLYYGVCEKESRSKMNVCFRLKEEHLEKELLAFSEQHNITGIAGHRSVGGFRVSLYNAITIADVINLIETLTNFENTWKTK